MNYFKFGSGDKYLIVIPGISIRPISESKLSIEKAFSKYTDKYTFVVLDRHEDLNKDSTVVSFANSIKDTLDDLNINKAYFYGTSQGGMIAQVLAICYPELVEKLVLCSTVPCANKTSMETFSTWKKIANLADTSKLNEHFIKMVYSERFGNLLIQFMNSANLSYTPTDFEKFSYAVDACLNFSCCQDLDNIKCPTLVAYDTNDKVLGYEGSKLIIDKLHCNYIEYNKYGHAFYDEAPDFHQRMFDFLEMEN